MGITDLRQDSRSLGSPVGALKSPQDCHFLLPQQPHVRGVRVPQWVCSQKRRASLNIHLSLLRSPFFSFPSSWDLLVTETGWVPSHPKRLPSHMHSQPVSPSLLTAKFVKSLFPHFPDTASGPPNSASASQLTQMVVVVTRLSLALQRALSKPHLFMGSLLPSLWSPQSFPCKMLYVLQSPPGQGHSLPGFGHHL